MRGLKAGDSLRRFHDVAVSEHLALQAQWQQRSGTIRVVIRVRPSSEADDSVAAVSVLSGCCRGRGVSVSTRPHGRAKEEHKFNRFDYVLGPDKNQDAVFHELRAMLPNAGPGGLTGPPQSACILAYGQTGSGKTFTMQGSEDCNRGIVPRVLAEVFHLARASGASVTLSAVEVYNDTAYDLLDG